MIFFCFWICYLANCRGDIGVNVNTYPGVKLAFSGRGINYIMQQSLDWAKGHMGSLTWPDIEKDVDTPIGKLSFTLKNLELKEIGLGPQSYITVIPSYLQYQDTNIFFSMTGDWKWEDKSFPYPSDSGTFDLSCLVEVVANVGAEVDSSKKSGLQVTSDYFSINFEELDIKVHGGASWLYNIFITTFKPIVEAALAVNIQEQLPDLIRNLLENVLEQQITYDMNVFDNVYFSYIADGINYNTILQALTLGVEGKFHSSKYVYPEKPMDLPNTNALYTMVSILISEYTVNSAGYVCDQSGLIEYTFTQKDIPKSVPIQLNTSFFRLIIPGLYNTYGSNKKMQIKLISDKDHNPSVSFSAKDKMRMFFDVDTVFQVILDNGTISDAFTLSIEIDLTGNLQLDTSSTNKYSDSEAMKVEKEISMNHYKIIGVMEYESSNMTVIQSNIGQISLFLLQPTIQFFIQDIIVPLINTKLKYGIPIPDIPYFVLQKPSIVTYFDGYVQLQCNFEFTPP